MAQIPDAAYVLFTSACVHHTAPGEACGEGEGMHTEWHAGVLCWLAHVHQRLMCIQPSSNTHDEINILLVEHMQLDHSLFQLNAFCCASAYWGSLQTSK